MCQVKGSMLSTTTTNSIPPFFSFHSSEHLLQLSKSGTFFSELDWLMEVTKKKVIEIKTYLKVIEIKFIFPAGLLSRTS